ncbi:MAG: transporter substrate-binding domain-containing protein [Desulforegulaceae bacterium]|nr:transporter substrate-binding domain-containing protein [Desulforegulaceae bacterium]
MNRAIYFCIFSVVFVLNVFASEITIVTEQYPPYEFIENGKWTGHDVDIVKKACERFGVSAVFKEYPWKRCLKMIEHGDAQAIISAMNTPDRQEYILFPVSNLSYEKNVILGHKANDLIIDSLDDLKGKTIGLQSGYSYGDEFDHYSGLLKDFSFSQELMLKKFHAKRTELIIGNEAVILYLNKKLNFEPVKVLYAVSEDPLYIGFSKVHPDGKELFEKFSKALAEMKKEGIIDALIKKYQ